MTKANLALVVVVLSNLLFMNSARAADKDSTAATPRTEVVIQEKAMPLTAQEGSGDMMELAGIFTGAMRAPPTRLAINPAGAPPALDGHMAMGVGAPEKTGGASGTHSMHGGPAGMGGMCPMMGHLRCPLAMLEGANALTDDQYQKLYDIRTQFIGNIVPKGLNVYMLSHKMKDLLTAPDIDSKAVKDMERQISAGASDLSMTVMDSIVSAAQVLTPEQRKELHSKMIRAELGGGAWKHQDQNGPHPEK